MRIRGTWSLRAGTPSGIHCCTLRGGYCHKFGPLRVAIPQVSLLCQPQMLQIALPVSWDRPRWGAMKTNMVVSLTFMKRDTVKRMVKTYTKFLLGSFRGNHPGALYLDCPISLLSLAMVSPACSRQCIPSCFFGFLRCADFSHFLQLHFFSSQLSLQCCSRTLLRVTSLEALLFVKSSFTDGLRRFHLSSKRN